MRSGRLHSPKEKLSPGYMQEVMSAMPKSPPKTPVPPRNVTIEQSSPTAQSGTMGQESQITASQAKCDTMMADSQANVPTQPSQLRREEGNQHSSAFNDTKENNAAPTQPDELDEVDENSEAEDPTNLPLFDWEDFEVRFTEAMNEAVEKEAEIAKEFQDLVEVSLSPSMQLIHNPANSISTSKFGPLRQNNKIVDEPSSGKAPDVLYSISIR